MRKAFECVLCEGIYADAPVSQCDCASKANVFSEGVILSGAEWESLRKDAERYRLMRKLTLENIEDTEEEFDAVFDLQTQVKP